MSLLIRGGTVVNHDHSRRADVLIEGDTIVAVGAAIDAPTGAEMIDAGGAYVIPGGIDPHTHLEMPFMGTVTADDFESGTKAALTGGTTMVVDFCLPDPGQSMLAAYQEWRHKSEKAAADYGFHMAVTSWSKQIHDEMETVVKTYGINTFKHFMAYKGALMVNDDELYNSFARCAHLGAMPVVHAENGDVVALMQEVLIARGVTGPEGHAYSRPPEVEGEATNRAIMIADMTGTPVYIVHTSCREAHEAIARARAAGKRVYGEPLIQHLLLDAGEYQNKDWDHSAQRVMSPPFRDKSHQDSLWAGLQSGSLQVVATDHCAFHHGAEAIRARRLQKDPERHRRPGRSPCAVVDRGRRHGAADQGGIRRGDLCEYRAHPQHLSAQGRSRRRLGCRHRGVGSQGDQDHQREAADEPDRLQCIRRLCLHRRARRDALARSYRVEGWRSACRGRRRPLRRAARVLAGACGEFDVERADRPARGRTRSGDAVAQGKLDREHPGGDDGTDGDETGDGPAGDIFQFRMTGCPHDLCRVGGMLLCHDSLARVSPCHE